VQYSYVHSDANNYNVVNSHHSHGIRTLAHPSVSLRVFCLPSFSRAQFLSFISFPSAQLIRPQYTFVFISSSDSTATRKCRRCSSLFLLPFTTYPYPTTRRYRLTTHTTYMHNNPRSCSGSSTELWEGVPWGGWYRRKVNY